MVVVYGGVKKCVLLPTTIRIYTNKVFIVYALISGYEIPICIKTN